MVTTFVRHRFTVDEYEQMIRAAILTADDRVELIEGEIIEMSPIGERHAACVKRLNRLFTRMLGDRAIVAVQDPIRLGGHSEPQPDLAILKPREDFYASGHPRPADILLVIDNLYRHVQAGMDTSQETDRTTKLPLYARAGIAEAWLVDLEKGRVEIHRKPGRKGYADARNATRKDRVVPVAFPGIEIPVEQILG